MPTTPPPISNLHMAPVPQFTSRHVAVIGAGAAGLVAARELRREGHKVVVFERENRIGGTWIYNTETEPDPLGLDQNRKSIIHSSLYKSLRTNLPREVMGFRDFPFVYEREEKGGDLRRFPGHEEVLRYLERFAEEFRIKEMVGFERDVIRVCLDEEKWVVKWRNRNKSNDFEEEVKEVKEEVFDAVVVCNGHFTEPRVAQIPGIDVWPGKQIHSHNYRTPEPFQDQVVVLIGNSSSAVDISREIAMVAKEVHIASWSFEGPSGKQPGYSNMWLRPMIESVHEDGTVTFRDGSFTNASIILHCTGYKYHFPFLETNSIVTVDDNQVGPLYKHIFPPALAPWLSFVGIPWKVVPFPQFEIQSKWIAGALSGRVELPSQEEMMDDIERFYSSLEASGIPKRYTHNMSDIQFEYNDWLAKQCGCPPTEEWRKEMYSATSKNRQVRPGTYRDEWEDDHLISQAQEDFRKYTSNIDSNGCIS